MKMKKTTKSTKTRKKALFLIPCVLPLIFAAACSGNAEQQSYSSTSQALSAETDVSQTAEPTSSASDSGEPAVSEEYEMFSVEHLKSTKYYQKVMDWFDEKGLSDEERQNLLNDPEFIKDAMRDSYWN